MNEEQGFRDLGERITRLETLVGELPGRIDDKIIARDNATRQLVAFNQQRLEQLHNDSAKLTSMVDSLHRRMDKGEHVTEDLQEQHPSLAGRLETLATEHAKLKTRIDRAGWLIAGAAGSASGVTAFLIQAMGG